MGTRRKTLGSSVAVAERPATRAELAELLHPVVLATALEHAGGDPGRVEVVHYGRAVVHPVER
jgi:hypothetical protein